MKHQIVSSISKNCNDLFKKIKYLKVSEDDLAETETPLLIVSALESEFEQEGKSNLYVENVSINFLILLSKTQDDNPYKKLEEIEQEFIKRVLNNRELNQYAQLASIKSSSTSNSIKQYELMGGVSTMIKTIFSIARSYF